VEQSPALLANDSVPGATVGVLHALGWDVAWIAESSTGIMDEAVLALAAVESRWLFAFDRDYGELAFRRRLPLPPAIVLLGIGHRSTFEPAEWMVRSLASEKAAVGGFFGFDARGLRWRPLPESHG